MTESRPLLGMNEAAEFAQVSQPTIREWIKAGKRRVDYAGSEG